MQDHITKELWQCLNDYYHLIRDQQIHNQILYGDPVSAFDLLIQQGLLYHGTVDNTMARGEGFNYLSIGKYLERAILSADMLNIRITEFNKNQQSIEAPAWRYLLYSLAGYELYVKTYRGKFETEHVVQQVLYSSHFPHSVLYCLQELARYFERLKAQSVPESYDEVEFAIGKALNNVKYSNIEKADRDTLKNFLQQTRTEIFQIANAFSKYYFGNS